MMPHRSADIVDYCTFCDEVSVANCLRCGRFLCVTHETSSDKRCSECEAGFSIELKNKKLLGPVEDWSLQSEKGVSRRLVFVFLLTALVIGLSLVYGGEFIAKHEHVWTIIYMSILSLPFWVSTKQIRTSLKKRKLLMARQCFLEEQRRLPGD